MLLNTLRPRQNGRHFADDILKWIFLNDNAWVSIKIQLKCVSKGPNYIIPALVQIMAWHRPGDKPLSETVMVDLLTHICVTRPQSVRTERWKGGGGRWWKQFGLVSQEMIRNVRSRRRFDSSSIFAHPVNFDIQRKRSLKCDAKNSTYIYTYIYMCVCVCVDIDITLSIKRYGFSKSIQPEITSF